MRGAIVEELPFYRIRLIGDIHLQIFFIHGFWHIVVHGLLRGRSLRQGKERAKHHKIPMLIAYLRVFRLEEHRVGGNLREHERGEQHANERQHDGNDARRTRRAGALANRYDRKREHIQHGQQQYARHEHAGVGRRSRGL